MLNLLRERRFVDVPDTLDPIIPRPRQIARLHRDGVEVLLIDHSAFPYVVGCCSGATLVDATLAELRRWHRSFLDDLDGMPDPEDTRAAAPVVEAHAARFRALMDVWEVCQ